MVVIVTDDQPKGLLDAMPNTRKLLVNMGVNLQNGVIPTSLCCPSRSSLLTGNNSHTTGVYSNHAENYGGWSAMQGNEGLTLATKLNDAGYHTGLIGKYMNGFDRRVPAGYVPLGWDEFIYLDPDGGGDGSYYNYRLKGTTPVTHYGTDASAYSTDVLSSRATQFISSTPAEQPLFLYFAPYGPHRPFTPAPRDRGTWALEPASAIPGLTETDVSDKPRWIRTKAPVNRLRQRQNFTAQHEVAMSVDDAIGGIVKALGPRVSNTILVFISDNGLMHGVHRIRGKAVHTRGQLKFQCTFAGTVTSHRTHHQID